MISGRAGIGRNLFARTVAKGCEPDLGWHRRWSCSCNRDGGKHWVDVSPPELTPWSKISQIDAGRFDAQTAYVSVNRFRLDDLHAYIYRTHDGGKTWKKSPQVSRMTQR